MKKTLLLILLASILVAGLSAGGRQTTTARPGGEIIQGSTTRMGNFFDITFPGGTNAANSDVIRLTQEGHATVVFTKEEQWIIDPSVVRSHTITTNADGSRTYSFTLHQDLYWSDGRRITASDYVGFILVKNSPEWRELGAHVSSHPNLLGHGAYSAPRAAGDTAPRRFQGVRLLGEFAFSVTIAADQLPHFFEIFQAQIIPYPMHVVAPGIRVEDSPQGAFLSGPYNTALLQRTVNDPSTGYRFRPTVFNGPYTLVNYDPVTHMAVLELNPHFKGLYDGHKPQIARIIMRETPQAVQVDMFATGEVTFLNGIGGQNVDPILDIVERPGSGRAAHQYPRAGFGMIMFRCDHGPTSRVAVRQAMAWISDREEFARQFTFGYGVVGHGWYGQAMREYQVNRAAFHRRMTEYQFNPARATQILVQDGWTLNAQGGPYVVGSGEPRHRRNERGVLEPLIIEWFSTEGNRVSDLIAAIIVPEAARVGIRINQTIGDFPTLLDQRAAEVTRFHMFNLATSWVSPLVQPWLTFSTDPSLFGTWNPTRIVDQELENLALAMRRTNPGDFATWDRNWLEFQLRFNHLLPELPLYSDLFFDFYPANLQNYNSTPFFPWSRAILWANMR